MAQKTALSVSATPGQTHTFTAKVVAAGIPVLALALQMRLTPTVTLEL